MEIIWTSIHIAKYSMRNQNTPFITPGWGAPYKLIGNADPQLKWQDSPVTIVRRVMDSLVSSISVSEVDGMFSEIWNFLAKLHNKINRIHLFQLWFFTHGTKMIIKRLKNKMCNKAQRRKAGHRTGSCDQKGWAPKREHPGQTDERGHTTPSKWTNNTRGKTRKDNIWAEINFLSVHRHPDNEQHPPQPQHHNTTPTPANTFAVVAAHSYRV